MDGGLQEQGDPVSKAYLGFIAVDGLWKVEGFEGTGGGVQLLLLSRTAQKLSPRLLRGRQLSEEMGTKLGAEAFLGLSPPIPTACLGRTKWLRDAFVSESLKSVFPSCC